MTPAHGSRRIPVPSFPPDFLFHHCCMYHNSLSSHCPNTRVAFDSDLKDLVLFADNVIFLIPSALSPHAPPISPGVLTTPVLCSCAPSARLFPITGLPHSTHPHFSLGLTLDVFLFACSKANPLPTFFAAAFLPTTHFFLTFSSSSRFFRGTFLKT